MSEERKLNFEVSNRPNNERIVQVRIPPETVREFVEAEIKALQKTVSLPGFRKGKVPASVIRSRWIDQVLDKVKVQLIEANTPTVMDQDLVDKKTISGSPLITKAKISEKKGLSYEIFMKTVNEDSVVDFTKPAPQPSQPQSPPQEI
jgi:trigger factor